MNYIRRHISISGTARIVAKRAQLEPMENYFLSGDNALRKVKDFYTETLISGHKLKLKLCTFGDDSRGTGSRKMASDIVQ